MVVVVVVVVERWCVVPLGEGIKGEVVLGGSLVLEGSAASRGEDTDGEASPTLILVPKSLTTFSLLPPNCSVSSFSSMNTRVERKVCRLKGMLEGQKRKGNNGKGEKALQKLSHPTLDYKTDTTPCDLVLWISFSSFYVG